MSVEAKSIKRHMDRSGWSSKLPSCTEMNSKAFAPAFSGAKRKMQMQLRELLLSIRYLTSLPSQKPPRPCANNQACLWPNAES